MDKMQVNFQFTGVIFFVHESIVLKNYAEIPATTRKCIVMIFLVTKKVDMKYLCQLIQS